MGAKKVSVCSQSGQARSFSPQVVAEAGLAPATKAARERISQRASPLGFVEALGVREHLAAGATR